jgi:hypothetical protein
MTKQVVSVIAAGVLAAGLVPSTALAQAPTGIEVPAVPPNLEVPAGNIAFLKGFAIGTQNYICISAKKGQEWRFLGPQATLFLTIGGKVTQQISTHFLSTNPSDGLARPTWQDSSDTSKVWGRAVQSSSDPVYVEAGAVPWLLLAAAGTEAGPLGGTVLTQTTYIQRLNTSGGVMPSTGCQTGNDVGRVALVPYTTEYYFYRADS